MNRNMPTRWALIVCFLGGLAGCSNNEPEQPAEPVVEKEVATDAIPADSLGDSGTESAPPSPQEEDKPPVPRLPELPPKLPSTQDLAAKELEKLGAEVTFNKNGDVDAVDFRSLPVTDEHLKLLDPFFLLADLNLSESKVSDTGLKYLEQFDYLRRLALYGTLVSDQGLPSLEKLPRLEHLCLDETTVSDNGLPHLSSLDRLAVLHLATTGTITEKGLKSLYPLKQLEVIKLDTESIDQAAIDALQESLPDLEIQAADAPES
ncbi:leucine-rich repeat domain-containing protein [Thalassoroseus pseudoceratinae]|uniref:hypothetical protein n=1 Tax=Thalassoroseus pseudoceratinae TaxID=2713176 RepID=UPI00197D97D1|nr:hypothetical protein [Thalassoroseus pseudoceratinae]